MNLNIWFIPTGLVYSAKQASKDTMYSSGLIAHGNPSVSVEMLLPPAFPAFRSRLTGLACVGLQFLILHKVVPNNKISRIGKFVETEKLAVTRGLAGIWGGRSRELLLKG